MESHDVYTVATLAVNWDDISDRWLVRHRTWHCKVARKMGETCFHKTLHHNNIPSYRTLSWSVCGSLYRATSTISPCSYTLCFIKTREQLHWVYFCLLFYSKISKRHLRIERWCQAQQIIYRGTLVGFSF